MIPSTPKTQSNFMHTNQRAPMRFSKQILLRDSLSNHSIITTSTSIVSTPSVSDTRLAQYSTTLNAASTTPRKSKTQLSRFLDM